MADEQNQNTSGASILSIGLDTVPREELRALAQRIIRAGNSGRGAHISSREAKLLCSYNLPSTVDNPGIMDDLGG